MKRCKKCGESKSLDDFHRHKKTKDGRNVYCKQCACAKTDSWQRENREAYLARKRAYRPKQKLYPLEAQRPKRQVARGNTLAQFSHLNQAIYQPMDASIYNPGKDERQREVPDLTEQQRAFLKATQSDRFSLEAAAKMYRD